MKVRYTGEERVCGFVLNEIYDVVDILQVCGEIFYLTTNNMEEKWYFKSKLFEIVEE